MNEGERINIEMQEIPIIEMVGGNIICEPQEGIRLFYQKKGDRTVTYAVFIAKENAAHISKLIQTGRQYWKRFRLPKTKLVKA